MESRKILLLAGALAAALLVAIVHHGSHTSGSVDSATVAAHAIGSHQPISATSDPITLSKNAGSAKASENEPWGPFRAVDW